MKRRVFARGLDLAVGLMGAALILVAGAAEAKVTPEQYAKLREETYEAAQGAVVSAAADAMTNVSARLGEGQGELAGLVKQREGLLNQINALRKQIQKGSEAAGAGVDAVAARARARTLRDQESALSLQLDALEKTIDDKFPAYAELTRPMPLKVKDTQALLEADEAVLLIVPAPDGTYVWAVTRDGFDWARSSMSETDITAAVQALRKDLDPSTATRGAVGMQGAKPAPAPTAVAPAGFDRKTAFKLYQEVIAPLEPVFKDKKVLFIATTGALQSLPFSVLVTAAPQGADNDRAYVRETQWLIDRYALVTLPAISSLRTLRCLSASKPHVGCVGVSQTASKPQAKPTIAYAGLGGPTLGGGPAGEESRGAGGWEEYSNGELADPDKLRALAPLPGAESEIGALSALFQKQGAFVRTRDQFTETLVKTSPDIRHAAVIHFATHALMGGETGSRGEPGLVLTPPAENAATAQDDGLLTASEAAALDIQAGFVVLSACNTARADGTLGADGLSGLARSFFYAGAKSLLVSHWSVDDKSTKELMVTMFGNLETGKVNRAVALQQAIQKVKGETAFVEPRYWAPFVLVGESEGL
jgi:CHAT domain-containing protein